MQENILFLLQKAPDRKYFTWWEKRENTPALSEKWQSNHMTVKYLVFLTDRCNHSLNNGHADQNQCGLLAICRTMEKNSTNVWVCIREFAEGTPPHATLVTHFPDNIKVKKGDAWNNSSWTIDYKIQTGNCSLDKWIFQPMWWSSLWTTHRTAGYNWN